jgi:hypothetical protein
MGFVIGLIRPLRRTTTDYRMIKLKIQMDRHATALNVSILNYQFTSCFIEWSQAGGLVGRGVLLDYVAYAKRHNIHYDPSDRFTFSEIDLERVAEEQKIQFKYGDLLFVRSGYVHWYNNSTDKVRKQGAAKSGYGGLDSTAPAREWLWNHHFAAVAGDAPAFEAMPPQNGEPHLVGNFCVLPDADLR